MTLLSSMSTQGMGPSLAVEGSTTREVFEAYLAQVLGPTLWPGQVVVMDNLSAHKGERVKGADRGAGLRANVPATLLAQPQPHRASVLEIKGLLRKAEARTREALVEAMGRAISAITPRDAEGYFEHRGYRLVAQQLCDKRSRILSLRSRAGNQ